MLQCPGAALVLRACNTEAMQLHIDEIANQGRPGVHAILILDQARWRGSKDFRVTQQLAPAAAITRVSAQQPRKHLAVHAVKLTVKRILNDFDDIVDHCCRA
jgi:hypothetical protein